MRIGGGKAQRAESLNSNTMSNGGNGVEQFAFARRSTARRGTRHQWQPARVGEVDGFGKQPGTARKLLVDELQVQRSAEGCESLGGGTRAGTVARGEAAADLTLNKGRDHQERARPLQTVLFKERVGEARHPFTGGEVGAAQQARQGAIPRLVRGEQCQARTELGIRHPAPFGVRHEFVEVSSLALGVGAIGAPVDRTRLTIRTGTSTRQRQHHAIAVGDCRVRHLELHAEQRWQRNRFGGAHEAHRARE